MKNNYFEEVNYIIPQPKEYDLYGKFMHVENRLHFHQIPISVKLKFSIQPGYNIEKEMGLLFQRLIHNEVLNTEQEVYIETDWNTITKVEHKKLQEFFTKNLSRSHPPTMNDFWLIFPKDKIILGALHEGEIFKADFSKSLIQSKFQNRFRFISKKYVENTSDLAKRRFELSFNSVLKNTQFVKNSKLVEITDLVKQEYPDYRYLLTKDELKNAVELLEFKNIDYKVTDRQKDKWFHEICRRK